MTLIGSRGCAVALLVVCALARAQDVPLVSPEIETAPLPSYDDAPATPDADDPAIWRNPADSSKSLVIGTLKDAGLIVYDLQGHVLQALAPANLPTITKADPPTPAGINTAEPEACPESDSGETFGRFNGVDIAYRFKLTDRTGRVRRADIAVVTDRGCDRLRFYEIAPGNPHGPLIDITSIYAPRVYPWRVVQPSPFQPTNLEAGLQENPLDEQDSAYGLGLWRHGDRWFAFVSQRNRSAVNQLQLFQARDGGLSYRPEHVFLFDPVFDLKQGKRRLQWTPCRESSAEDPQSEGIVIDRDSDELYIAFETIGVYQLSLKRNLPFLVKVGRANLIEPAKSFGKPYWATPDDDEFECEYEPEGVPATQTIVAQGSNAYAGAHLEVDVEGLAIAYDKQGGGYLLVSSQGDDTVHLYEREGRHRHVATFGVEGTGETDGLEVVTAGFSGAFDDGVLVLQNGQAVDPPDTGAINGYEYDGSTQFKFVSWTSVLQLLGL